MLTVPSSKPPSHTATTTLASPSAQVTGGDRAQRATPLTTEQRGIPLLGSAGHNPGARPRLPSQVLGGPARFTLPIQAPRLDPALGSETRAQSREVGLSRGGGPEGSGCGGPKGAGCPLSCGSRGPTLGAGLRAEAAAPPDWMLALTSHRGSGAYSWDGAEAAPHWPLAMTSQEGGTARPYKSGRRGRRRCSSSARRRVPHSPTRSTEHEGDRAHSGRPVRQPDRGQGEAGGREKRGGPDSPPPKDPSRPTPPCARSSSGSSSASSAAGAPGSSGRGPVWARPVRGRCRVETSPPRPTPRAGAPQSRPSELCLPGPAPPCFFVGGYSGPTPGVTLA